MLDIDDYITREQDVEKPVAHCECCGNELYNIDTIVRFGQECYCDYDCFMLDVGAEVQELEEDTACDFCGCTIEAGTEAIKSEDYSYFCDKYCLYGDYDLEEVDGYDL